MSYQGLYLLVLRLKMVSKIKKYKVIKAGSIKIENLLKTKVNKASRTDFLIFKAKSAFFSSQKTFIQVSCIIYLI